MLSTRAWCNPNQILAHYPQNREMNQRALLPAIPQGPEPGGRPGQRSQLIPAIGFTLQKNVLHSGPAAYKPSDYQCTQVPTVSTVLPWVRLDLPLLPLWKSQLFFRDTPWSA